MIYRFFSLHLILFVTLLASEALAQNNNSAYLSQNYFKASMGYSEIGTDYTAPSEQLNFQSSVLTPVYMAYGFSTGPLSFEGELGFHFHNFDFQAQDPQFSYSGDLKAYTLMANAFYKVNPYGSGFYLGGGLGFISVAMDGLEEDLRGASLAAQAMAGFDFRMSEKASFFLEGRMIKTLGLDIENDLAYIDFDLDSFGVNMGFKYFF